MVTPRRSRNKKSLFRPIRLLVADDHESVREGLSAIFHQCGEMTVVAQAANGHEAVSLWQAHLPDVTLLDLRMPTLDGVQAMEEIRRRDPDARVMVFTGFEIENDISRALKAGARACVLKDAPRDELLESVRRVHSGGMWIPSTIAATVAVGMSSQSLTRREQEVLEWLAQGKCNKEIAGALNITETTVKSHLRRLFAKLHVLSRTEAVRTASRRGLVRL
jgi:two-component system NarL family response regulator